MSWNTRIREAFDSTGRHIDDAVIEELADHADDLEADLRQRGVEAAAVEREIAAQVDLWVQAPPMHRSRRVLDPDLSATTLSLVSSLASELRYAVRALSRQPGPFAVGATTIALGICAVAVMANLVWGVLLQPLPWPESDRLVRIYESRQAGSGFGQFGGIVTNGSYLAWQRKPATIDAIGAWSDDEHTLSGLGQAERVRSARVSPSLFDVLRTGPLLGRPFRDADTPQGAGRVVLISHAFWTRRLDGRRDVLGLALRLDGEPFTIVGVMGTDFTFPDRETALWIPFHVPPTVTPGSSNGNIKMFSAMARLKPGVTAAQAAAEATARAQSAPHAGPVAVAVFGSDGPARMTLVPALDDATRDVRPALLVLLAAVCLLLAASIANVANVQLARTASRRRELAIRSALGASSGQLARQLVVESVVVGLAGGLAGLLLATVVAETLPAWLPADFPRVDQVRMDWHGALTALVAAVAAGVGAGLLPAWQARRLVGSQTLAEDGRAPAGQGFRSSAARARSAIMAAQVAIATVLLVGAALLSQSFAALMRADRGFDTTRVLTAELPLTGDTATRRNAILDAAIERIRSVPGVVAAGYTNILPLTGSESMRVFDMQRPAGASVRVRASFRVVSGEYMSALGMRVAHGRLFSNTDTASSRRVAVVNAAFARQYLGGRAVGSVVPLGSDEQPDWEIVGVVDNVRSADTSPVGPEMFVPAAQWRDDRPGGNPVIALRTLGPPTELSPILRSIVADIDPTLALGKVATMEERVLALLARPRLYSALLASFAATALAIASVGLFGVLSFSVAQRSRELAVRSALGATPASLLQLVLRQGLVLTSFGLLVGMAASLAMVGAVGQRLYGVSGRDPLTLAAVALFLLGASAIACVAPALRAARLDPVVVLKSG